MKTATSMQKFYYVYILVSESDQNRHYIGKTQNLDARLKAHNSGRVPHTSKYSSWRFDVVVTFHFQEKDTNFEKYLKSHSGRAFAKKHF